ncbi:hypothetical protein ACRRTK_003166 [Alexandromys fortis]
MVSASQKVLYRQQGNRSVAFPAFRSLVVAAWDLVQTQRDPELSCQQPAPQLLSAVHILYLYVTEVPAATCCIKVLKEISVGELNPNETVQASVEAQLLSKLNHPAIVKFHASFVEEDNFCIITEYCEGRDLDYKIQEYKEAGKIFPENQIVEWFIQLLLGVDYMHERYADLLLGTGDFGVSRLLMGSCELATTLTGTPHYMSPEALKHQGYDAKSDIWSLACILYEMCCMDHAFAGSSFLSVVLNIVEGDTPSLPERFSRELNTIMERMLNKSPSLRPSAIEVLKIPYIEEHLQHLMCKYSDATLEGKNSVCQKDAVHLISAMQKKIHLQTLQALSEVQKMTPRERMRLRKLQAADEKARKLKKIVEEKYKENSKQMKDSRFQEFEPLGVGMPHELDERTSENLPDPQSLPSLDLDEVESSLDDTIVGLGHYGVVLLSRAQKWEAGIAYQLTAVSWSFAADALSLQEHRWHADTR